MSDFWEEFKDLFKTDSRREEERRQEINNALQAEKELSEQLQQLDREYRESLPEEEVPDLDKLFPEDLGLEKIDYTPDTDEQIAERAQSETDYKKATEKNKLDANYDSAVKALEEESDKAGKTLGEKYRELEAVYGDLKKQTGNDSVKRGMARSTVLTSALHDLDTAKFASREEAKSAYDATMTEVEKELRRLEGEQETALAELDLKYAAELSDRIAELKEERDATAKKYADFNNSVAEKEQKYAVQREKDIAKYLENLEEERLKKEEETREYEKAHGYSGDKLENYSKRYDLAFDFYSSLSPDIAVDALKASPTMRYYLGNFYDKLLSALTANESTQKKYF